MEKTKNDHFEKSQCRKNPLDFLKIQLVAKYQKILRRPFGDIETFERNAR